MRNLRRSLHPVRWRRAGARSWLSCAPVAALVLASGAGLVSARARPSIAAAHQFPSVVRIGTLVVVRGSAHGVPAGTRAALELKRVSTWSVLAGTSVRRDGSFVIRWRVSHQRIGPVALRLAALVRGHPVASTAAVEAGIGPAPVYCAPPVPPAVNIPVGSGWIVGGAYLEGGPYPGIYACETERYTITARNQTGTVVAMAPVAGGHSYTLVLPAGTYALKATPCGFGSAVLTAGKQTVADVSCPVP